MKEEKISGIYCIQNKINQKRYIGQSTNIYNRWEVHRRELNSNKKVYNKYLQNSWNKYGEENFEFSILEECDKDKLNEREIYWIEFYNTFSKRNKGFNKTRGGEGGDTWSYKKENEKEKDNRINFKGEYNPNYREISKEIQDEIIKIYQEGRGICFLVEKYGAVIYRILKENNIHIRNQEEAILKKLKIVCPKCNKKIDIGNYKKYGHGDNCLENKNKRDNEKIICPKCNKKLSRNNFYKFNHGENCKKRPKNTIKVHGNTGRIKNSERLTCPVCSKTMDKYHYKAYKHGINCSKVN
jgi:group I intron endonuclease